MESGNTVDRVAAGAGEMRHPDRPLALLLDQPEPLHAIMVARISRPSLFKQSPIDFINDSHAPETP